MANRLVIMPTLRATRLPDGGLATTRKFIDGIREYRRHWDGEVRVLMQEGERATNNLDEERIERDGLGFELATLDFSDRAALGAQVRGSRVVMASVGYQQNHVSGLCRDVGVACVYVSEYTLRTRWQIVDANESRLAYRWRRRWWEWGQERRQVSALRKASGVQCNGTPTFEAYKHLTRSALLYFDTRVSGSMLASREQAVGKGQGGPIRLVFSGRLIRIKGADHLVDLASRLRARGVDFHLTICGDGDLVPEMRRRIEGEGLGERVALAGVLPFERELVPFVKERADLFVCCHRQGDPSCTYLETMSCGVPIVGYANEAWEGLHAVCGAGWKVAMDDVDGLARAVASIAGDRATLRAHAEKSLEFASRHTFEKEFERRVDHLRSVSAVSRGG